MANMVVEHFKDAVAVYRRFRDNGRMAPGGLAYVSSWVDDRLERCYQLMETDDRRLLDEWMANWSDFVNFEVHPVLTPRPGLGIQTQGDTRSLESARKPLAAVCAGALPIGKKTG